jgi:D-alanyl-D-alanine carboxypeptidase/D-alanyl-D-alanine-endopeptidase (penicillin-binding protein 4)
MCTTTAAGTTRTLKVTKLLGQNQLDVTGTLPAGNGGYSNSISVTRPAEFFAAMLKQRLESKGITIAGQFRVRPTNLPSPPAENVEIAKLESPPFSLIAAKTMKPSQNMFTETILLTLGEEARKRSLTKTTAPGPDSATLGIAEVNAFLTGIGIPSDGIMQYDGSGLSRHDLITPNAVVTLYTYMAKQSRNAQAWRDSLTIGGVDGTLARRFVGTAAQGNIRGKTGTIDQVSALSGYVKTAAGEELVVSFIVNGVAETRQRTSLMDDIVVYLANFNGKID